MGYGGYPGYMCDPYGAPYGYHPAAALGGLLSPGHGAWNPEHNVIDMVAQEVTGAHQQLGYIRTLEAKLKGKKPGDSETSALDWEMLATMKKDLGMPVG